MDVVQDRAKYQTYVGYLNNLGSNTQKNRLREKDFQRKLK